MQDEKESVQYTAETYPLHQIVIPKRKGGYRGWAGIYPFTKMEIGQTFFVPGKSSKTFGSAVNSAQKRSGRKFSVKTLNEKEAMELFPNEAKDGAGGVAVTRTQ